MPQTVEIESGEFSFDERRLDDRYTGEETHEASRCGDKTRNPNPPAQLTPREWLMAS